MSRSARRSRPQQPFAAARAALPHPSWVRRDDMIAPSNRITPDDFWAKLGL